MGKLTLQNLANVLTEKNGLSNEEALHFVTAAFDAVQEGLQNEKLVKIKGLGTFKIIEVEARESINVNTGERVVIGSHSKITFTPDAAMKDLVNKPFSGFDTVVLNDGVTFDDMNTAAKDTIASGEEKAADISETQEKEEMAADTSKAQEKEEKTTDTSETPEAKAEEEETFDDYGMHPKPKKRKWLWPAIFVLGCGTAFFGGYRYSNIVDPMAYYQNIDSIIPNDSLDLETDSVEAADKAKEPEKVAKKEDKKEAKVDAKKDSVDYRKYEEMDNRLRTGAYRIVGTDRVIKSKPGETLGYISGRVLGPDMVCYLEVYNGMKQSNVALEAGTEIKIPKLELKRKKKVNKEN